MTLAARCFGVFVIYLLIAYGMCPTNVINNQNLVELMIYRVPQGNITEQKV